MEAGGNMYFSVKGIHKEWESRTVDFSMSAESGTITCILGPSGIGKSTVLNIIAGLERNTGVPPEIILAGKRIDSLPPARRGVGMVFQSGALFNHLDVRDNVAYGLVSSGMRRKESRLRADEFLCEFGLEGFGGRMPQTLSGGERQRVALARTLITKPSLVLLDEPFSSLDAELRSRLALRLKEWREKFGFTALMVTHDEDEARTVSDQLIRIQ